MSKNVSKVGVQKKDIKWGGGWPYTELSIQKYTTNFWYKLSFAILYMLKISVRQEERKVAIFF